jgi:tRNA A-37 threonylcarbamoyl transferase component Bud32
LASAGKNIRGSDWAQSLADRVTAPPHEITGWMEQHTRLIKSDQWSRVGLLELREKLCFLKLYLAKSRLQRLAFRLGYCRAVRSFDAALELAKAGLPVPQPLACLSVPGGMMLLTEGIVGGQDLRTLWLAQPGETAALDLLAAAGETLATLHRAGFSHGDCKWSNLLWCHSKFYLVDLEAVRSLRGNGDASGGARSPHPRQQRDLARFTIDAEELGASPEFYERFLASYLHVSGCGREQLIAGVRPLLPPIRQRHRRAYNTRVQPLL